jgi:hypothetical protein
MIQNMSRSKTSEVRGLPEQPADALPLPVGTR